MTDPRTLDDVAKRERKSHIWAREANEHYVEPDWCSIRLFEEEDFSRGVYDPACGFGTIVGAALGRGIHAIGSDLVKRVTEHDHFGVQDFFDERRCAANIVTNPPFNIAADFARHALLLALGKVAIIFPTARLNAAHWLKGTPLRRVWMLSPRPSMPPGHVIAAGGKAAGGKMDYCWLIFEQGWTGHAEIRWLYRDGNR